MSNEPKGPPAARWRKRKGEALRGLKLPPEALPGSLSLTHRRCGKPNCRCAKEGGHPVWQLTFMAAGRKRVELVPAEWVAEVQRRVAEGRAFKDAVAEVLVANAELLALRRKQRRRG
jgi:hypothetical protein